MNHLINQRKIRPKVIRCDNSSENVILKLKYEEKNLGITFEFIAPKNPQQNGVVERNFTTLYGRICSMMNRSRLEGDLQTKLWVECASTEMKLENLCTLFTNKKERGIEVSQSPVKLSSSLTVFGEMAIISKREKISAKLRDKGFPAIFVGYADNYPCDICKYRKKQPISVIIRWTR